MDLKSKKARTTFLFLCLLILLITFFTISCKESITQPEQETQFQSLREIPDNAIPGVTYLGCGYNAFGEYAATISVKHPIIDFKHYSTVEARGTTYDLPTECQYLYLNDYTYSSNYGRYASEYLERMSQSISMSTSYGGFFTASVTTNFSREKYTSYDYAFCTIQRCVRFWRLTLPFTDVEKLREMMLTEARDDIDNLEPKLLFGKYGTHLTTEIIVGARADYNCEVEKNIETENIKTKISACAEASFKAFTGSGEYSGEWEEDLKTFRSNSSIYLRVAGGRAEYGLLISEEGEYRDWLETIEENPVMCSFTENSLLPIWELCVDEGRRQEVLDAFYTYAGKYRLPDLLKSIITDMKIMVLGAGRPDLYVDYGYQYLPEDLNADAGGDYIYIQYKQGLEGEDAIDSIGFIMQGQDYAIPEGWVKLPEDLNAGAGGDFIYLCYKKTKQPEIPIRRLAVIWGGTPVPEGFQTSINLATGGPQDLNQGTGDRGIWLTYSYEQPKDAWE